MHANAIVQICNLRRAAEDAHHEVAIDPVATAPSRCAVERMGAP